MGDINNSLGETKAKVLKNKHVERAALKWGPTK